MDHYAEAPPMTSVRANCPACGEVEMPASELLLIRHAGIYRFICPSCDVRVEKPADRKVIKLLRRVGVPEWVPPITEAEADQFAAELESTDAIGERLRREGAA